MLYITHIPDDGLAVAPGTSLAGLLPATLSAVVLPGTSLLSNVLPATWPLSASGACGTVESDCWTVETIFCFIINVLQ